MHLLTKINVNKVDKMQNSKVTGCICIPSTVLRPDIIVETKMIRINVNRYPSEGKTATCFLSALTIKNRNTGKNSCKQRNVILETAFSL